MTALEKLRADLPAATADLGTDREYRETLKRWRAQHAQELADAATEALRTIQTLFYCHDPKVALSACKTVLEMALPRAPVVAVDAGQANIGVVILPAIAPDDDDGE